MSRYTVLYRDKSEGLPAGGCVTIQSLYHDRWAVWLAIVSQYNRLYRDRRKAWSLGLPRYNVATRPSLFSETVEEPATRRVAKCMCAQRHGRGLLRHDRDGATTRSRVRHDTAQRATTQGCARGLSAVGAQLGFRVCTWCTQPSF